jgi:hypothetical protein
LLQVNLDGWECKESEDVEEREDEEEEQKVKLDYERVKT